MGPDAQKRKGLFVLERGIQRLGAKLKNGFSFSISSWRMTGGPENE
jgi:hypothetical protein